MSFIPPDILGLREETEREIQEETMLMEEEREEREGKLGRGGRSRRKELEAGSGYRGEFYSS